MTVVNYSVQDTFGNNAVLLERRRLVRGAARSSTDLGERFLASLVRNLFFSAIILAIEIPLGIAIALSMPREGWRSPVCLVLMALPLLIPWNVVGTIWQIFGAARHRPARLRAQRARASTTTTSPTHLDAWATVIVMDVWHWTSLVVLLCYAGLTSIPDAYYQAAQDRRRLALGGVPLHPAAEDEPRAD